MRRYETIFIVDSELSDEGRDPILERLRGLTQQHDGFLVQFDEWGSKKLAYEIKGNARGYYVRMDYCGDGSLVNEIERFFRIDDRILKYMTVLLEKSADLDQIKEEAAQVEAERRLAEQAKAKESRPEKTVPEPVAEAPSEQSVEAVPEAAEADTEPTAEVEPAEPVEDVVPETPPSESNTEET